MTQIRVLEVPLKPDTGDYDRTHYLHQGWEDEDKRAIEKAIREVENSTQPNGTRTVDTANGEVTIQFEVHPDVSRRKLVKGFLELKKNLNQRYPGAATFKYESEQVRDDFEDRAVDYTGPTAVEVPDLAGLNHSEASDALAAMGLRLGNRHEVESEEAKGKVLAQYPAAGTKVNSGKSVSITVSGSATILVQGVSGRNLQGRRRNWGWRWRRWWWRSKPLIASRLLGVLVAIRLIAARWWRPLIGSGLLFAAVVAVWLIIALYPLTGEDTTEKVEPAIEEPEPVAKEPEPVIEDPEPVAEEPEPPTANFTSIVTLTGAGSQIAFSPDGGLLAIGGGADRTVKLWDPRSRELGRTLSGHTGDIHSFAFSPSGRFLASGSADDTIKLWDSQSGEEFQPLTGHKSDVKSVAINPNGGQLASGSADDTVKLWDLQSGSASLSSTGGSDDINSVAFSPDGSLLASGDSNWAVKVWYPQSGELLRTLGGYIFGRHYGSVTSVAFSPDGSLLASGSVDGTVKVWDSQSGELLRTLGGFFSFTGHSDDVTSVAFSPDGSLLASGSADDTVKVWDSQSGKELQTLTEHSSDIESVAFSPDGRFLASGARGGTVKIQERAEDER